MLRRYPLTMALMSWRFLPAVLTAVGMIALAACTVTPLYSAGGEGESVAAELSSISILPAADRLTQIARNELVFAFGGEPAASPRYELSLSATSGAGPSVPGAAVPLGRLAVTIRYSLVELETGEVILNGSASAATSYQQSNQGFATLRAREDAEERATRAAADTVRLEIALALAARLPG